MLCVILGRGAGGEVLLSAGRSSVERPFPSVPEAGCSRFQAAQAVYPEGAVSAVACTGC